jgi:hypothetical protein
MSRRLHRRAAAWLFAAMLPIAVPVAAQELHGTYSLAGEMAAGTPYQGTITLTPREQAFDVVWDRASGLPRHGFALRLGNVLGIAAEDADPDYGVVLYKVERGHLDGIWQSNLSRRVTSLGRETLDGPEGLDGRYAITLGVNPDGSNYSGLVAIHQGGPIYSVIWYTGPNSNAGGESFAGTGIMIGDVFVVGYNAHEQSYAEHQQAGVAAFCLRSGKVVEGITALITDGVLGAEQFWAPAGSTPLPGHLAELRSRDKPLDCGAPIVEVPTSAPNAVTAAVP